MPELKDYPQTPKKNITSTNKKFLSFSLGQADYAIDLLNIQEIHSFQSLKKNITPLSDAPSPVIGMVVFQDSIVPLIDLRLFYQLPITNQNEFNVIIILNFRQKLVGIIVDAVSDILEINEMDIKPASDLFSFIEQDFIQGIGIVNDHCLIILDIEKLISTKLLQIKKYIEVDH